MRAVLITIPLILLGTAAAFGGSDPEGDEVVRSGHWSSPDFSIGAPIPACGDASVDITDFFVVSDGQSVTAHLGLRDHEAVLSCGGTESVELGTEYLQIDLDNADGPIYDLDFDEVGVYISMAGGHCARIHQGLVQTETRGGVTWVIPVIGVASDYCNGGAPLPYSLEGVIFDAQAKTTALYAQASMAAFWAEDEGAPFVVTL